MLLKLLWLLSLAGVSLLLLCLTLLLWADLKGSWYWKHKGM